MTAKKTAAKAVKATPAKAAPAPELADAKDAEINVLRAEIEQLRAAAAPPPEPEPTDPKDRAIAALKAELAELRRSPEGEAAELRKALSALQEQVAAMQSGVGKVPVPESTVPDPYLYHAVLATGEVIECQHPIATAHYSEQVGAAVPVLTVFAKADRDELLAAHTKALRAANN